MPFTDIAVYFVIAILGLAYPISLQVLTRLDEKYSSVNILKLFEKELWGKVFNWSLFGSLVGMLLHISWKAFLKTECPKDQNCSYFPDFLLLLVVAVLVTAFLFYTKKIFIYYSPYSLVEYLKANPQDDQMNIVNAMADIFYLSIRLHDATLSETLHQYFYQRFREIRIAAGETELTYPIVFYQLSYNALIEAGEVDSKKNINLSLNIASGRYYLGEHQYTRISPLTFTWLWNSLKFITETKNDDFAFEFWTNSHQFISSSIPAIRLETNRADPLEYLNKEQVDQREREREKFFEFHIALGGMFLYAQRYKLINRIFRHTTSNPPRFELLPSTMTTIFALFIRFIDPEYRMFPYPYHFFQSEGIPGENLSQHWICKYLALTLLRQYTINYHYGQHPVTRPNLPATRGEKKQWLNAMEYFKSCTKEIQNDKELMETTGLNIITSDWCTEKGLLSPGQIIDQVTSLLTTALNRQEVEQEISTAKVGEFYEKSASMISKHISTFSTLLNKEKAGTTYEIRRVDGAVDLIKKEAFADDQGVSYVDFNIRCASKLVQKITTEITDGFFAGIKINYLFKAPELFQALRQLNPDPKKYLLLNFGVHIPTVNSIQEIDGLSETSFQNIQIIQVHAFNRRTIESSLLLIKKEMLPALRINDQEGTEIEKYALHLIDNATFLYGTVIDLNQQPQFKTLFSNISQETLDTSVLTKLSIGIELYWRQPAESIQLKLYSEFHQDGIVNKLTDVKKL